MKTLLIIDSKKHKEDSEEIRSLFEGLKKYSEVLVHDMNSDKMLHEHFFEIKQSGADLFFTVDGAGFELRTESDRLSFNVIPGRFIHLFSGSGEEYSDLLNMRMNFSHFVYFENDIKEKYDSSGKWLEYALREALLI